MGGGARDTGDEVVESDTLESAQSKSTAAHTHCDQ